MFPVDEVLGVVLCGGASRRMGTNKALLPLAETTCLERAVACLRPFCRTIVLLAGAVDQYQVPGCPVWIDDEPGGGPLFAITTALGRAEAEWIFVLACDMPFLTGPVAGLLLSLRAGHDAVVPLVAGHLQTTCALYRKTCLPVIREMLARGERRLHDLPARVAAFEVPESWLVEVDPGLVSFRNLNTPEDYFTACQSLIIM